jgi:hypothetical protein
MLVGSIESQFSKLSSEKSDCYELAAPGPNKNTTSESN